MCKMHFKIEGAYALYSFRNIRRAFFASFFFRR
jgi:hypothetical protein